MILSFDRPNKLVIVPDTETEVTVQEVYDQCRDYEDLSTSMSYDELVYAEGKTDLGGGKLIVITLFMINGWRIAFEDRAGPGLTVCQVLGGNTVGRVGDQNSTPQHPIAPTANTHVTIDQASTGLAVVSTEMQADIDQILLDARVAARGEKITKRSTDPATVPGTLEVYDPDDDSLVGTGDLWEDEDATTGYQGRGIDRQGKVS